MPAVLAVRPVPAIAPPRRRPGGSASLVFVAFLPNAPYVLTDVVHMPTDLSARPRAAASQPPPSSTLYAAFADRSASSPTPFSLLRLGDYLRSAGSRPFAWPSAIELGLHMAGRGGDRARAGVFRFNSWDLLARPEEVLDVVIWPQRERTVAIVLFLRGARWPLGTMIVRAIARAGRVRSALSA